MAPAASRAAPDGADLAVHHPARADHVGPGRGVQHGHLGVDLHRGVVVDQAGRGQHAAVPVVGELVQADVGHHQAVVADLGAHRGDRGVQDAVRVQGAGADGVLGLRDAEQHHPGQPGVGRLDGGLAQGVEGVLDDSRHRADRPRLAAAPRPRTAAGPAAAAAGWSRRPSPASPAWSAAGAAGLSPRVTHLRRLGENSTMVEFHPRRGSRAKTRHWWSFPVTRAMQGHAGISLGGDWSASSATAGAPARPRR